MNQPDVPLPQVLLRSGGPSSEQLGLDLAPVQGSTDEQVQDAQDRDRHQEVDQQVDEVDVPLKQNIKTNFSQSSSQLKFIIEMYLCIESMIDQMAFDQ